MALSETLASNRPTPQDHGQDVQTLISLLGDLVPLLLRVQTQPTIAGQSPLLGSASFISNPLIDHQASVNFVQNIAADAVRTVSNYLETNGAQNRELEVLKPVLAQASNSLALHDYAQSFNLIFQAYRLITALRSINPQLPPLRSEAEATAGSSNHPSTQH